MRHSHARVGNCEMRIAYLLMVHDHFSQVKWIIDAIYTSEDYFLIHIDSNSQEAFRRQVRGYLGDRPNVRYLAPRHINRFGWSVVKVELEAIRDLVSSKEPFDYLINVSGQDYPIKPIADIRSKLAAEWPRNFIDVIPFDTLLIDFSGQPGAPAEGVGMLKRGGRLVLGSVVDTELTLGASSAFMAHELQVRGAYVSSMDDLAAVIELAQSGRLDASGWVSHRMALDDFAEALEVAENRPPGTVRVVVEVA